MPDKPHTADGYSPSFTQRVEATCLTLATWLGDFWDDLVVVGGLVPTLLIRPDSLPTGTAPHVGTLDLDIGLEFAIFDEERYRTLAEHLRRAGFAPDTNEKGNPTQQRWKLAQPEAAKVDFLVPPSPQESRGGKLLHIQSDFAAFVTPGLQLAFRDRLSVQLDGLTAAGEKASRPIWVCGPGAYVVLKALAFRTRGDNKDAYDLHYLVSQYGTGVQSVVGHFKPLLDAPEAQRALQILREDFQHIDSLGPRRVADFLVGGPDDAIQADVLGFVTEFLSHCQP
jgi:hypothetical protein